MSSSEQKGSASSRLSKGGGLSLDVLRDNFISYLKNVRNASPHTLRNYSSDITGFFDFLRGISPSYELKYVDRSTIRGYLTKLYVDRKAKATAQRKLSALKSFFRFLVREGYLGKNVLSAIRSPKGERRLPSFMDNEEVVRLIEAPDMSTLLGLRDRAILEVLYSTGIRVSELVGLNVEDVDLIGEVAKVRGKGKMQRMAPMGREAAVVLSNYLQSPRRKRGISPGDAVFLNRAGARLTTRSVARIVAKYVRLTALKAGISPHTLRHTFATHLLNAGADLRSIQELLGHKSLSSTVIYTHVSTEKMQEVYSKAHPRA
ncbi:tyrosine recombinase XerC [bacterium]|nr:tyrosine recombinase XerC [bacterium]